MNEQGNKVQTPIEMAIERIVKSQQGAREQIGIMEDKLDRVCYREPEQPTVLEKSQEPQNLIEVLQRIASSNEDILQKMERFSSRLCKTF